MPTSYNHYTDNLILQPFTDFGALLEHVRNLCVKSSTLKLQIGELRP